MKKILLTVIALLLCAFLLVSCGKSDGGSPDESDNSAGTNERPGGNDKPAAAHKDTDVSEYYKWTKFDLSDDLRQAAVDYMYEQASVEWVCSSDFGVKESWENWGINLDFRAGVTYTGQPYANSQVNVALFKRALVNGKYTATSTSWDDVHGSQCVSSILNALQQTFIIDGWSYSLNPGSQAFQLKKLGDYEVEQKPVNSETPTKDVCKANGQDKIYDAYTLAQKGDVIMTSSGYVHCRMVVENYVERTPAGVLNPRRSFLTCIEQTNTFDATRKDVNTTWYVEHTYTYDKLYADGYLPSTSEVFETGVSEIPYIVLDAENTAALLAKKAIVGKVKSNYPLRYVVLEALNKDGSVAATYTVRGSMTDYAFVLRTYSFNFFNLLEPGDYTFVLTAGIAIGEYEFERIDFTLE